MSTRKPRHAQTLLSRAIGALSVLLRVALAAALLLLIVSKWRAHGPLGPGPGSTVDGTRGSNDTVASPASPGAWLGSGSHALPDGAGAGLATPGLATPGRNASALPSSSAPGRPVEGHPPAHGLGGHRHARHDRTGLRPALLRLYEEEQRRACWDMLLAQPWWKICVLATFVSYVAFRRGHHEESLLVLRGLGLQTSSTSSTYLSLTPLTRFIPTAQVQDIFIHEAFKGFEVRFYVVVVVEGEDEVVVVFPKLLPRLHILEQVWRGARACLYDSKET